MNALVITNQTATRMAVIAARTGSELMAGAKAMIKKNGEVREAFGTTNASVAAKYTNGNGCSREYFKTTAYFDIEKGEWRSFRWESIVKVF